MDLLLGRVRVIYMLYNKNELLIKGLHMFVQVFVLVLSEETNSSTHYDYSKVNEYLSSAEVIITNANFNQACPSSVNYLLYYLIKHQSFRIALVRQFRVRYRFIKTLKLYSIHVFVQSLWYLIVIATRQNSPSKTYLLQIFFR